MWREALAELRRGHGLRWWLRRAAIYGAIGPYTRVTTGEGLDVVPADWDTLVVLDACREDLFRSVVDTDRFDAYRAVTSRGSATVEWLRANFAGRDCGDTVCVTANPYTSRLAPDAFHELVPVWETEFSDQHGTVPPDRVTARALEAAREYPDKRLVVHYMQPHHPFLDADWGDEYFHNPRAPTPWELLEAGVRSEQAVQDAYRQNLARAWPAVERLLDGLEGHTVVTSDHGNLLGESLDPFPVAGYGHSIGLHVPELVEVPWAVHRSGARRSIVDGQRRRHDADTAAVEERLAQLGYRPS
jgi:hypothetical protein